MIKRNKPNKKSQINSKNKVFWSFEHKGQINQVFTFIMALLVMGLIVLIASKSIFGINKDKCEIDLISFNEKLKEGIIGNNDFGSVTQLSLRVPCSYQKLCVLDSRAVQNNYDNSQLLSSIRDDKSNFDFIIYNSIKNNINNNIFLSNGDKTVQVGFVKQLQLADPNAMLCFEVTGGAFNIKTKGQGRFTQLSAVVK